MFCRHPWLLAWPCATNLGLSASRPLTLRVCARPAHQPARAAKAPPQRLPGCHRTSPATVSEPLHQRPPLGSAYQKPSQGRDNRACSPNSPAPPVSACGLLAAHPMPRASPDAAAPEDRFPRRQTPPWPLQLHPQASTESEASPMAMPTTIDGRAAVRSSLVRAWGLEGYARIQHTVRETDVSSDADFQRFYNRFYRVRKNAEWQSSYYAIMGGEVQPLHGVRGHAARDARAHGQRGGIFRQQDERYAPSRQADMEQPGTRPTQPRMIARRASQTSSSASHKLGAGFRIKTYAPMRR